MHIKTIIRKGEYHDSVVLLEISHQLGKAEGIKDAIVVMGSDSNKEILRKMDMLIGEAQNASADDLVIAIKAETPKNVEAVLERLDTFFVRKEEGDSAKRFSGLSAARQANPNANCALISVPGAWAGREALSALKMGMNVLLFSDNVPLNEEIELKKFAASTGLLIMGPDCGVCNINGAALALASMVDSGPIGLIGASGSGVQEIAALLQQAGSGISQAIGTGGHDLHAEVGASTMIQAMSALTGDRNTQVLVLVGKKPQARAQVLEAIRNYPKPIVACFLGDDPAPWKEAGAYFAPTLEAAARAALALARKEDLGSELFDQPVDKIIDLAASLRAGLSPGERYLRGIFGGGTFVAQAQWLLADLLGEIRSNAPFAGGLRLADPVKSQGHCLVDLGDEAFTLGRAHPVIDPLPYLFRIKEEMEDPQTAVLLMDVILGPAVHPDPAGYLVEAVDQARQATGRQMPVIVSVCGTDHDPQNRAVQESKLSNAGLIVMPGSAQAALLAGLVIAKLPPASAIERLKKRCLGSRPQQPQEAKPAKPALEKAPFLNQKLEVINVGAELFAKTLWDQGVSATQVNWSPPAGGNLEVIRILDRLDEHPEIQERIQAANQRAYEIFVQGQPMWVDVRPAGEVVPGYHPKLITHAGPPINIDEMDPMFRAGVLGAALIEGLAGTREEAWTMIKRGEIELAPAWWYQIPIAGMSAVSYSMPVMVAEDATHGTRGYSPIMEGASFDALRSGVYNQVVHERWTWFQRTLGPVLSQTLQVMGGINLRNVVSRSLLMGDENHSRESASTLIILAEIAPHLVHLDYPREELSRCLDFIRGAERFSQNILIAGAASVLAAAKNIEFSTVVTGMGGNGVEMGLMISAFGDRMFTAPAPIIYGRYLNPNTKPGDTVPFAGDSCAVTVYGLGGCAAAASPAVTLLGGGTVEDAINRTREMWEITVGRNHHYTIPNLNFEGTPTAFDILKILRTGILPISHAGIVLKTGGLAGAGNARIPMELFVKGFLAYAEQVGL